MSAPSSASPHWRDIRRTILDRDGHRCRACNGRVTSRDADVHHLLPRAMGGSDEMANLITLCDGCHAARHPHLAGGLARRVIERWAYRLARWLDRDGAVIEAARHYGPALRLLGVPRFRDGQLPVVEAALQGKSLLFVSPTGSGKSLCFQLPALLRRGVTVVVSPLKALMADQQAGLHARKVPAMFINSDLSREEKSIRYALLRQGGLKFLYLAPERFTVRSDRERAQLTAMRPAFLVIDEAHCIDQWGGDFRPEYGELAEIRRQLGSPPVLAFTATAGQPMQRRILQSLGIDDAEVIVRGVDRPNITLLRREASPEARAHMIARLLQLAQRVPGKTMIFVPTVKIGEDLQAQLAARGVDVPFYHSKLSPPNARLELLHGFTKGAIDQIICTNAFGMGIDVGNVRLAVHWQPPASVEDYLQEFGRAGRDGQPAAAVIFYDRYAKRDTGLLEFMAERTAALGNNDPRRRSAIAQRKHQIADMARLVRGRGCFRRAVVGYFAGPEAAAPRSLARRILDWTFSERIRATRSNHCCDACDARTIERVGWLGYVATVLGMPTG